MLQKPPHHLHLNSVVVNLPRHFVTLSLIEKIYQEQTIVSGQSLDKGLPACARHHDAVEQYQRCTLPVRFVVDVSAIHFKGRH